MVSLPLDIVPHILSSLDVSDLESCSLVTHAFNTISQEILFSYHLVLCSKTWRAKSSFLLGERGRHLCERVKNLTVRLDGIPGLYGNVALDYPRSNLILLALLGKVAPQLDTLSLNGIVRSSCISWKRLIPYGVNDFLCDQVLPYIRRLDIENFVSVPLLGILSHCRCLDTLDIGARYGGFAKEEDAPFKLWLPKVSNLTVAGFKEQDFGSETSLGRYSQVCHNALPFMGYAL
ncbi:hypothetical protein DL96DRAFT_897474 [Flagelloscypha sp. PMI_526]|nr:hypothetical protein DL96DRAFT_897474 [Flagelloscypha sp. PMI_526]